MAPRPIILITPIEGTSPYLFTETTHYPVHALWNPTILSFIWFSQTLVLAFRKYMCVMVLILSIQAGHPYWSLFCVSTILGNGLVFFSILWEAYCWTRGTLRSGWFLKAQSLKTTWLVLGIVVLVLQRDVAGFEPKTILMGVVPDCIACAPFMGAFVYGRRVHERFLKEEREEGVRLR